MRGVCEWTKEMTMIDVLEQKRIMIALGYELQEPNNKARNTEV